MPVTRGEPRGGARRGRRLPGGSGQRWRTARLASAFLLLLLEVSATAAAAAPAPAIARADASTVELAGVVRGDDGSPIGGATITVGDRQVQSDAQGHWRASVAYAPRLREFVSAPGYVDRGYREIFLSAPNAIGPELQDTLQSIFDPDAEQYTRLSSTPPTVMTFVSDTGVSRSQEVPAETSSITVSGSVGQRDGRPVVRGDGYLARPDEFVDQVAVAISGDTFTAVFPFKSGPGAYRLEINDTVGAAIINVPVFVGVAYQAEPPNWPDPADLVGDGPVARAIDALQQVREAHGLAAYALDPRLEQVARDHVDDMVAHRWICHCWADGSSVLDHVRAAGVEPARVPVPGQPQQWTLGVGNGISTAPGAAGIRGLFASPGHRLDLLGGFTHVGIAYAGQASEATSRLSIVYATEQ